MAQKITRQADAATKLLPDGWKWTDGAAPTLVKYDGRAGWNWGYLHMIADTAVTRIKAYKAMCDMLNTYEVEAKVGAFLVSGPAKFPMRIQVMPISDARLEYVSQLYMPRSIGGIMPPTPVTAEDVYQASFRDALAESFNLNGWTMADGTVIPPGEYMKGNVAVSCCRCKRAVPNLATDPADMTKHYCRRCVRVCPGIGDVPCTVPVFHDDHHGCATHYPRQACANCQSDQQIDTMFEIAGVGLCCYRCHETTCQRCGKVGAIGPDESAIKDGQHERYLVCAGCRTAVLAWIGQDRNERIVLEKPCSMVLEASAKREVRLASVELEITTGAQAVLDELYSKGLTTSDQIAPHWRGNANDFCYMEADGSLPESGGELIFSKMRLDDTTTASKLSEAMGVLRKHVKKGAASIDLATGAHVHIDAHRLGINHVRNLVVLHNFIEDPFYRISAANYTRHRGVHYASLLPKEGLDDQATFNRLFFAFNPRDDRAHHSVLNVAGYYSALQQCQCGHMMTDPENCTCNLGKCTVEFRVFNGTSSWKKLHAYMALCMSMVAYAKAAPDMHTEDFTPTVYNPVAEVGPALMRTWTDRLTWVFENLWFTEEERESIHYCIEKSELNRLSQSDRTALRAVKYRGNKYLPTKSITKSEQKTMTVKKMRTYSNPYSDQRLPSPNDIWSSPPIQRGYR